MLRWLLLFLLLPSAALSQVVVRYSWTQPDSTAPTVAVINDTLSVALPGFPLRDGDLREYNVYLAAGGDTTKVAVIPAPPTLTQTVSAALPVPIGVVVSVAVEAVDARSRVGLLSLWSEPLTITPGPPRAPGRPVVREVYLSR